jgi:hypothetical protein
MLTPSAAMQRSWHCYGHRHALRLLWRAACKRIDTSDGACCCCCCCCCCAARTWGLRVLRSCKQTCAATGHLLPRRRRLLLLLVVEQLQPLQACAAHLAHERVAAARAAAALMPEAKRAAQVWWRGRGRWVRRRCGLLLRPGSCLRPCGCILLLLLLLGCRLLLLRLR